MKTMDCGQIRRDWDKVLIAVGRRGHSFVVLRDGEPVARLVPPDASEQAEGERRYQLIESVRRRR